MKLLWKLASDPNVPEYLRIAHVFTFDRAFIAPEDREVAIHAFQKTFHTLNRWEEWGPNAANHWSDLALALALNPLSKRARGYGINCTSVADVWNPQTVREAYNGLKWMREDTVARQSEYIEPPKPTHPFFT